MYQFKQKLEDQYLQPWDKKVFTCTNLERLYKVRKNYKCSKYLKSVSNIEGRRKITKLRLGCSKLNSNSNSNIFFIGLTHMFLPLQLNTYKIHSYKTRK